MIYFVLAFFCFAFFILAHALLYRIKIIQFETWKLILLFILIGLFYLFVVFRLVSSDFEFRLPWSSFVCYILFSVWYLGELTTVQYSSPSMKILRALMSKPDRKITADQVSLLFTDEELIFDRLKDLVLNGHIIEEGGQYRILPRGRLIMSLFNAYRALLGRKLGG